MRFVPQPNSFTEWMVSWKISTRQHVIYDRNRLARCLITIIENASLEQRPLQNRTVSWTNGHAPNIVHLGSLRSRLSVDF